SQAVLEDDGQWVQIKAPPMGAPRYFASEGRSLVKEPRPQESVAFFEAASWYHQDERVRVRTFTADDIATSFEAERTTVGRRSTRTVTARWFILRGHNFPDVLAVSSTGITPRPEMESTPRELADSGHDADDLVRLYRAHGGTRDIGWVFDMDPLPR